jgi:putative ATP-dependent endonuclease of the OLD family
MSKEKKTSATAAAGVPAAEKAAKTLQEPADAKPAPPPACSGIVIKEVRVRNYRCLRSVDVELDLLTVLIGQNNAGKTSFLNALFAAIGAGQRIISGDDVFLQKTEVSAPKHRMIAIDILIRPTDDQGKIVDVFPQGSPWLELWGLGVVQDDEERDLVAIRTQFKWNTIKGEYILDRRFLKDWQKDGAKWEDSKPVEKVAAVSAQQIEPLAVYLLDAKRDIAEDLRTRSSFWSKMVEEHGLSAEDVRRIEEDLSGINKDIVESSDVLTHIQSHLKNFHETLSCDEDSVSITPLARHLRDLSRGMDVVLSTRGAPPFPLHQQGMGTRSLGTFFTFWAFTTWRQKQGTSGAVHPMMAMEEPETHLHPQAQRSLFRQIKKMPGQRIISTHSPYVCGQSEIAHIRHFSKTAEETLVSRIDMGTGEKKLTDEDLRKIDRQVMNTRGDMLFARALVFFEGETEEQALPDFAEKRWGKHPNDLGFSFVGVGGSGNYLPFLRMAESFKIPWFIFSDGEPDAIIAVNAALAAVGQAAIPNNPRVIVLPGGKNFETYIVTEASKDALIAAMIERRARNAQHRAALQKEWAAKSPADQIKDILAEMQTNKTPYGSFVGKVLPVPAVLEDLFKKIDSELTPPKPAEKKT